MEVCFMRQYVLMVMLLVLALALVPILSLTPASAQDEGWTCPEGYEGQTLRIFNWSTYVAEDTIPNFEEACDVTVEYFEFGSDAEALAVVRSGAAEYDIVVPAGATTGLMIEEGLVQPLDFDIITNYDNLLDAFKNPPYDPNNEYSIAYQWGTIGIGYDVNFAGEINSWEDVFNYDGPVAWLNDERAMLGVGLLLLGYDPNSTDADEIAEAGEFLLENAENVTVIADDNGQDLLLRGDVDITVEYSGDIFQIMSDCECEDFAYVIPSEGSNVWTDNMVVPATAPNPELAMVFINYILDPQVGADLSNFTAYGSPNAASIEQGLIDEELLGNSGIYPSEETLNNLFFAFSLGGEVEQLYTEAWTNLQAELSQ